MAVTDDTPAAPAALPTASTPTHFEICVLGSGSKGNCTVLRVRRGDEDLFSCLIDLGLSPRMTAARLDAIGMSMEQVQSAVLTHLDRDHCHEGWAQGLSRHVEVFVHKGHLDRAYRYGLNRGFMHGFEEAFDTRNGLRVAPVMTFHDVLGTAAFRVSLPAAAHAGELGFATDCGRVTDELLEHLRGVDVLAIESNYCPVMQAESERPEFLKRRITGGRGHLSNDETLEAIHAIGPSEHVVLLHLSRECNCPERVAGLHEGADYSVTIAGQDEPTRWVRVERGARVLMAQGSLFGPAAIR